MRRLLGWLLSLTLASSALAGTVSVHRVAERADAMARREEFAEAMAEVETALAIDPTYTPVWLTKAMIHIGRGEHDEAGKALAICLLRDPHDIEPNFLFMMNEMKWPDAPDLTGPLAGAGRGHLLDGEGFADVLALFLTRRDLPEMIQPLIAGWRRSNTAMDRAKRILQHYAANRLEEAERELIATEGIIPPRVWASLHDLVNRAVQDEAAGLWVVERGHMFRDGEMLTLSSDGERQAFAWLSVSPGWRNTAASLDLAGVEDTVDIFLRYESPESFIRLRVDRNRLAVHERIPNVGLVAMLEVPRLSLVDDRIRLALLGDRFGVHNGTTSLGGGHLVVSPLISSGSTAIAVGGPDMHASVTLSLAVTEIADRWQIFARGGDKDSLSVLLDDGRTTGLILEPIDGGAHDVGVAQILFAAAEKGMVTFARLPRGNFDLALIYREIGELPDVVMDALWTGVIFELGDTAHLERYIEAERAARRRGLQTALVLTPETAAALVNLSERPRVDWLLCLEPELWPEEVLRGMAIRYAHALYASTASGEAFSSLAF